MFNTNDRIDAKTTKKLLKALKRRERLIGKPISLLDFLKMITEEFLKEHNPNNPKRALEDLSVATDTDSVEKVITFECDHKTRRELEMRS